MAVREDRLVPPDRVERLVEILRAGGAVVTVRWDASGHTITPAEVAGAHAWRAERVSEARGEGSGSAE